MRRNTASFGNGSSAGSLNQGVAVLTGERMLLRAASRHDVEEWYAQAAGDYLLHAVTASTPWRPEGLEAELARYDKQLTQPSDPSVTWFTIARRDDPDRSWLGRAGLWGIDEHQRSAHLGITLASAARGQGLGTDTVRVLCDYAFRIRDLYRLNLETLATNEPMLRAARACGFVEEGRLREAAYVLGTRIDEVQLGLLRPEWDSRALNAEERS
jgi:RimJ/RimL family protein N-acetyltransferase